MTFLNVGQGDSVFIETPQGVQILVDGGTGSQILRELHGVMSFYDRTIDIVIATHPDKDHIGGLPDVFSRFHVGAYIRSSVHNDGGLQQTLERMAQDEAVVIGVDREMSIYIDDVDIHILFPDRNAALYEKNTASIIMQVVHKNNSFLLTGDAPKSIEEYLLAQKDLVLQSSVLKLGHHGSKTSSDRTFIETVNPTFAVISAGSENSYGHPHSEVLKILEDLTIPYFETKHGPITFVSDGEVVRVEQ